MMISMAILALVLETSLAFPTFGSGSYTLNLNRGLDNFGDDTAMEQDSANSSNLRGIMMQFLAKPGTNPMKEQRDYTTIPSREGQSVLQAQDALTDNTYNPVQCLNLPSNDINLLLYCLKLLSDGDQIHQSNILMKRGYLKLNPTGWKRKKRSTDEDIERELENARIQSMLSRLLQKRQKPRPVFNPTGW